MHRVAGGGGDGWGAGDRGRSEGRHRQPDAEPFPEFRGEDFRPWINEEDARKKGKTPDEFAQGQADLWKKGLGEWGQTGERVRQFTEKVDVSIYTPGSSAGLPVSILSSLGAPSFEVIDDAELFGERIESTVSSLLGLMGIDADPIQSREHILMSSILGTCWRKEEDLDLAKLIGYIQSPPFEKVGVLEVEAFYPEKKRFELAMALNNLLAAPGFASWLEGEPLDIQRMLYTPEGKPRISIFSIAHLNDTERMFFVSLLFNQTLGWMRAQAGTSSLRALLYMDEIYGYLPPTANPPSKKPIMTMLKQARAFGLGVLLATQNPVDLDYKALSNIGTWFLGRLQTERDKARVLDGLEGAAAQQDSGFNRARMEEILAGLGTRVFLLNNVHEDGPVTFQVRWVMSYLRGPLTRTQIKKLMDPKRPAPAAIEPDAQPAAAQAPAPAAVPAATEPEEKRPAVPASINQYFMPPTNPDGAGEAVWLPAIVRCGEARIVDAKKNVNTVKSFDFLNRIDQGFAAVDWLNPEPLGVGIDGLDTVPPKGGEFAALPPEAAETKTYTDLKGEFTDWIYHNGALEILHSPTFDEYSQPGESEGDFRARLQHKARELRDDKVEELRASYASKLDRLQDRLRAAERKVAEQAEQSRSAKLKGALNIGATIFGVLFGRKRVSMTSARSVTGSASKAWKESKDVDAAEERVEELHAEIAALEAELLREIESIKAKFDPLAERFETESIRPLKKNISVKAVGLAWLPFYKIGDAMEPAW
ncbi:MAG: hypothetical protein R3F11_20585 [Verrucomicrobiales bacterium]